MYSNAGVYLHRDTTQTGIKMAVTTKSRNSYTFIGKYSDSHRPTQGNPKKSLGNHHTVSWKLPW